VTTFTITCAPTVGTRSFETINESSITGTNSGFFTQQTIDENDDDVTTTFKIFSNRETRIETNYRLNSTDSESNTYNTEYVKYLVTNVGTGLVATQIVFLETSRSEEETRSWNGGFTRRRTIETSISANFTFIPPFFDSTFVTDENSDITTEETILTEATWSRSQTTTTSSGFFEVIRTTAERNTFTLSATISNGRIRATQILTTTKGSTLLTTESTSVITTTSSETNTGYGRFATGNRQIATVVCLTTSQVGYIITERPNFSTFLSAVAAEQADSQFTVFPRSKYVNGHIEEATLNEDGFLTVSTSQETSLNSKTFQRRTNSLINSTVADLNPFGPFFWPPATKSIIIISPITETYQVIETLSDFTGGDISTVTTTTTNTHNTSWGTLTWNGVHSESTTIKKTYPFEITWTNSTDFTFGAEDFGQTNFKLFTTVNGAWERGIPLHATPLTSQNNFLVRSVFNENKFVASSIVSGCASPENVTRVARIVGPAGLTITGSGGYLFGARTAAVPAGTWNFLTNQGTPNAFLIRASADGAGVTLSPPETRTNLSKTVANWTTSGQAASSITEVGFHRPFLDGEGATRSKTAIINAGVWITKNNSTSGTIELEAPEIQQNSNISNGIIYLPAPLASYVDIESPDFFIFGRNFRYFTSSRHTSLNYDSLVRLMVGASTVS
jgi:hypothetical protein